MTVWHEPLGVDFSRALVVGLRARMAGRPPEAMARVRLLLPTRRMERRVREMFHDGGAAILPRIGLVSDVSPMVPHLALPPARSALALRLELARLVDALLGQRPDLAPRGAAFDLAGSLGALLQEMKEERVTSQDLALIDAGRESAHWQDNLAFLRIAAALAERADLGAAEDVQTVCLDALEAAWAEAPPEDMVIVAGSTGSRAPTLRLMRVVAGLEHGQVVLPGLDVDMPGAEWVELDDGPSGAQDHPQYRHHAYLKDVGLAAADVAQWSDARPACPARNRLMSLALRPPPVTDAWLDEGPAMAAEAEDACAGLTLVEADTPLEEAEVIALRLRAAVEEGRRAALISPDRTLSRQVAASLDRWGIEPDDSAGRPLDLSPPGRLLMQTALMRGRPVEGEALVALLKHPLTHSTGFDARREHLRRTRDMELDWLRGAPQRPSRAGMRDWLKREKTRAKDDAWHGWVSELLLRLSDQSPRADLATHVAEHVDLMEDLGGGAPGEDDPLERPTGDLWGGPAGREALKTMRGLAADAEAADGLTMTAAEYARLLRSVLAAQDVRDPFKPHPDVMIWGALEARVQGADLVILGGLVDGTWPSLPAPDMWLNRTMRAACRLRCPERAVGLSAHDFQQAVAGREVWLTMARRTMDAPTVPSRWLNRLISLLGGMGPQGRAALQGMRDRGAAWRVRNDRLARPHDRHRGPPASRPAPSPPPGARPRKLSVTQIETLIRDPYSIYARTVLNLHPLDPLRPPSDARLRGTVVHDALTHLHNIEMGPGAAQALLDALEAELARNLRSAGQRGLWMGRFARIVDDFVAQEAERRRVGRLVLQEGEGVWTVPGLDFRLTGRADRMDERADGIAIYDYKTGAVPTDRQQRHFAKQLLLEALMVSEGAFADIGPRIVTEVAYLGIGREAKPARPTPVTGETLAETREGLRALLRRYLGTEPFTARLAHESITYSSDYDHLARYGEWDDTRPAEVILVGAGTGPGAPR